MESSKYYRPELLRFSAYLELVSGLSASVARNVMLSDVRDVLFQGDPFLPAVLPAPKESSLRPGAALPYVLFTEEVTHIFRSSILYKMLLRIRLRRLLGRQVLACPAGHPFVA